VVPGDDAIIEQQLAVIRDAARQAGRDPADIGLQGLVPVVGKSTSEIRTLAGRWRELGATHITIDPRSVSLHVHQDFSMVKKVERQRTSTEALIEAMRRGLDAFAEKLL
jgi:hypothetical protein